MAVNIDDEIANAYDAITASPAYNPAHASPEDSLEYLEGVATEIEGLISGIKADLSD